MESWLRERKPKYCENSTYTPRNGEEMSLCRVGKDLYESIFKHYTKKQWDRFPLEMDASVLARLPIRLDTKDTYFNDPYEALPSNGYTNFFENMILKRQNIDVRLNMDYFKVKDNLPKHRLLVFTGPIDAYFAHQGWENLEYRSIYFQVKFD